MKKLRLFTTLFMTILLMGLSSCDDLLDIFDHIKDDDENAPGYVFTLSNAKAGNEIIAYVRSAKGELQKMNATFPTGGKGTGAGLGSQGALVLQDETKMLFAVNAGSNEVSVLKLLSSGPKLLDVVPSGGKMPISLTVHKNLVYVVNAGEKNNITGFRVNTSGKLLPLPGSTQYLSADQSGPAQIQFSPDGKWLVVTEKMTNKISTFQVDANGVAGSAYTQASSGQTPFGFYFRNNQLFVSEAFGGMANKSALTSYQLKSDGMIQIITASAATKQTAACWTIITKNGKYAYTANTGSGSITGFSIAQNGSLSLLNTDGRTGITGDGTSPIDMALNKNSQYLFNLNSNGKAISVFKINSNGSLQWVQEVKDLPAGVVGLAAM